MHYCCRYKATTLLVLTLYYKQKSNRRLHYTGVLTNIVAGTKQHGQGQYVEVSVTAAAALLPCSASPVNALLISHCPLKVKRQVLLHHRGYQRRWR